MYKRDRLFSKLGLFANTTLVESTKLCRVYRHEYIELEHWLKVVASQSRGDIPILLEKYDIDLVQLNNHLDRILQCMPNVSSIVHDISIRLEQAVERGLIISQIINSSGTIRTGHILLGILTDSNLRNWIYRLYSDFKKIDVTDAIDSFTDILQGSIEKDTLKPFSSGSASSGDKSASSGNSEDLLKWCSDITEQARNGLIDPVIGREMELRQIIDILLRRRQNNPILVGEAGVGKTAIIEALALSIINNNVPTELQDARILSLDLGSMQAGSGVRGEFENRLKRLIEAIRDSEEVILLFCDEAHTLIGAGGQEGTGDAVNLLKPMLARGELRMIAATTWSEYKQYIEPDAALTRRFQSVYVTEPDEQKAVNMVRGVAPYFAKHHNVIIMDSAIIASVRLSYRHLPLKQLPDKAISLLDTACARVSSSQDIKPSVLENLEAQLKLERDELKYLESEIKFGEDHSDRISKLNTSIEEIEKKIEEISNKFEKEKSLIDEINASSDDAKLELTNQLLGMQENRPLVYPWVDQNVISDVLSDWIGIPSERMIQDDLDSSLNLEETLNKHIFGQKGAINKISSKVQMAVAKVQPNDKPLGVFLLTGPSGTGKTETAITLADLMYGGSHNLIVFNMTEFQESHSVSVLKGAPPGYVGYGKGGKLTEEVRKRPFSVILLDEFDKAHPDIHEIFYQVFDKGWMKDGEGRIISFKQCFIFLTSNIGSEEIEKATQANPDININELTSLIHDKLVKHFSLPLLARMDTIPYIGLNKEALALIANKNLGKLKEHFAQELEMDLIFNHDLEEWIANKVFDHPNSGRAIKTLLEKTILPPISKEILKSKKDNLQISKITLSIEDDKLSIDFN